jgi:hypothetical protein
MPRQIFVEHITGRTVQQIVLTQGEDGYEIEIEIQFTDKTGFHIELEMKMLVDLIELRDWTDGNGKLIKKLV